MKIEKNLWFNYLVYLSLIPLFIKGISYLIIQLFYPFIISVVVIGYVLFMLKSREYKAIKTIKFWSILIVLYGITRIVLFGLVQIDMSVVPSGVFYQFNFWYHLKTLVFIVLGYLCFSQRKHYVLKK